MATLRKFGMGAAAMVGACLVAAAAATSAATAAGAATSRPSLRPLKVAIQFTKDTYAPHAVAHLDITLTNDGSVGLHHIGAACARMGNPDELRNLGRNWGALAATAKGVDLAAHTTRTFHITVHVPAAAQRFGQVVAACDFGYRNVDSGYRPIASDTARVPGQTGALEAAVQYYVNGNRNKTAGLEGVKAVLVDPTGCPLRPHSDTTGSNGVFTIRHVPAGTHYELYLLLPRGWKLRPHNGPDPSNTMVLGKDTVHEGFYVMRGKGRRPTVPTRCS